MKSAKTQQDWVVKAKEIVDKVVNFITGLWDLIIYVLQNTGSMLISMLIRALSFLSPTTIVIAALSSCLLIFGITAFEWWKMGWEIAILTSVKLEGRWVWALGLLVAGGILNLMQMASTVEELFTNAAFGVEGPLGDMLHSVANGMKAIDDSTKVVNKNMLFCIELVWLIFFLVISGAFIKAFGVGAIAGIGIVLWLGFMVRAQDVMFKVAANIVKILCN